MPITLVMQVTYNMGAEVILTYALNLGSAVFGEESES
jgi:hypothetical protein